VRSTNRFTMINVKITMVDGTEYNVKNIADSVKDFHKRVIAPYGTNMSFIPIMPGVLIYTGNIVSIREMSDEEVIKLNEPEEVEEAVGLTDTDAEVEDGNLDIENESLEAEKTEEPIAIVQ